MLLRIIQEPWSKAEDYSRFVVTRYALTDTLIDTNIDLARLYFVLTVILEVVVGAKNAPSRSPFAVLVQIDVPSPQYFPP
jgi:hypothetical protein